MASAGRRTQPAVDCCSQPQLKLCSLLKESEYVPTAAQASQADVRACLRTLTNLQQLQVPLELTAATLAALVPLTALTKLHLVRGCLRALVVGSQSTVCGINLSHPAKLS